MALDQERYANYQQLITGRDPGGPPTGASADALLLISRAIACAEHNPGHYIEISLALYELLQGEEVKW